MTTALEERMASLEGPYQQIDHRLGRIESKLDQMKRTVAILLQRQNHRAQQERMK
jgi:hypothetical protein